jgi:antitoxin component YwqK of YwqJK toxin-antitoxin module
VLEKRDGLYYEIDSSEPYTGQYVRKHENGRLASELYFKDGVEHGVLTQWDIDGTKQRELHYEGGMLNGPETGWYKDGQKSSEAFYTNDERHGLLTLWSPNGTMLSKFCYQSGELANLAPKDCPR